MGLKKKHGATVVENVVKKRKMLNAKLFVSLKFYVSKYTICGYFLNHPCKKSQIFSSQTGSRLL